jgi:hypothetical protein
MRGTPPKPYSARALYRAVGRGYTPEYSARMPPFAGFFFVDVEDGVSSGPTGLPNVLWGAHGSIGLLITFVTWAYTGKSDHPGLRFTHA